MKISAIVPVVFEERCEDALNLASILSKQNQDNVEIIIVVGKSLELYKKISKAVEGKKLEGIKVIYNPGIWSLSSQRNFAIPFVSGEIIAFLDDDVLPLPSWAEEIRSSFRDCLVTGVTGPVEPLPSDGKILVPKEISWVISCTSWVNFYHNQTIPYGWGGNMAFRRSLFDNGVRFSLESGLGAKNKFLICEDSDFAMKATQVMGGKIVWNSKALVFHRMKSYRINWGYMVRRAFSVGYTRVYVRETSKINKVAMESTTIKTLITRIPKRLLSKEVLKPKDEIISDFTLVVVLISLYLGFSYGSVSNWISRIVK